MVVAVPDEMVGAHQEGRKTRPQCVLALFFVLRSRTKFRFRDTANLSALNRDMPVDIPSPVSTPNRSMCEQSSSGELEGR